MNLKRLHVYISGRVQGVFFRDSTRARAQELDVSGWVRNLPDGRVEAVFEGPTAAVQAMLEFVKTGPEFAQVTNVEVSEEDSPESYSDFSIR